MSDRHCELFSNLLKADSSGDKSAVLDRDRTPMHNASFAARLVFFTSVTLSLSGIICKYK
jgi:hypothetical protein